MLYRPEVVIPSASGSCRITFDGTPLSDQLDGKTGGSQATLRLAVVAWTSMIADSPLEDVKPVAVIRRFFYSLCNDYRKTSVLLSSVAHTVTKSVQRDAGAISRSYVKEMEKTPVYREYLHFYRTGDSDCFRFVIDFLSFGKKVYYDDPELDATALREWLDVEEKLKQLELPAFTDNIARIINWLMTGWDFSDFLPKHGNGSVAEKDVWGVKMKNEQFATHQFAARFYTRGDLGPIIHSANIVPPSELHARLKFVPKDLSKRRTICMEPIALQWLQQGIRLILEAHLADSPLGLHFRQDDQGINRAAARFGSMTGLVDTIDLKSASDSVAWSLVKSVVPTSLLIHLAASRSSRVLLPSGEIHKSQKFAPMGSALCFPVQTMIYGAVQIWLGIAHYKGWDWRSSGKLDGYDIGFLYRRAFSRRPSGRQLHQFFVYGDDIICDKQVTSNTMDALSLLGFTVNGNKSYTGHDVYRESCGGHYLLADDVTPTPLKLKKIEKKVSIEALGGIIDHLNAAHQKGYRHVRKALLAFALHYPIQGIGEQHVHAGINPLLFSDNPEDSFSILCSHPRNVHLAVRRAGDTNIYTRGTHIDYQRDEILSITAIPNERGEKRTLDAYDHAVWWRSRYRQSEENSDDPSEGLSAVDTRGVRAGWRWSAI